MPKTQDITIRVQSKDGTKRVVLRSSSSVKELYDKVREELKLGPNGFILCQKRDKSGEIARSARKTLQGINLSHGDMLYLKSADSFTGQDAETTSSTVVEDEIDVVLYKDDGLIHRSRDPQLCHHGPQGKCLHCSPLEPYDENYLKALNPPVKHMSFHAYVKKLTSGVNRGKFVSFEDTNCKIKPGCKDHPPWPKGICTKCQPSAITLNRQPYRHTDNILFENSVIVDKFLNFWRSTGCQRIGFLYGYYERHENVPLGIRATVAAIYEPPQESRRDSVELHPDPHNDTVESLASDLGLRRIGWIFTDLIPDDTKQGTVKHLRHMGTYFLSAQECVMAADFQNQYPNACKLSANGKYGSKFCTVVVSGNEERQIHFDGWQVSNQCMALVRDDCLVPTLDEPGLGYVKESSSEQYVPDVFYKEKDNYGNEVTQVARPMPIEYFLTEVPAAFPLQPLQTFKGHSEQPFPIENRMQIGEAQSFNSLVSYMSKFERTDYMKALKDFHLLVFMATSDMLPLKVVMKKLCEALVKEDEDLLHHWSKSEEWSTVEQMIAANGPATSFPYVPPPNPNPSPTGCTGSVELMDTDQFDASTWTCKHCTFINPTVLHSCEMCGLPMS